MGRMLWRFATGLHKVPAKRWGDVLTLWALGLGALGMAIGIHNIAPASVFASLIAGWMLGAWLWLDAEGEFDDMKGEEE